MPSQEKPVIETSHLSFGFTRGTAVVKDINLQIPKGAIYGFLGPNGAGKTTTIRLLLNLLKPASGTVTLFGEPVGEHPIRLFARIGALIETPSLYEHLTGWDNLRITAKLKGIHKDRIREVLELVQLSASAAKPVKTYSLGMKQRLGLALALLSSPELLILDEPTNGLDPTGIVEIRALLLHLCSHHGITILVSSHLLSEIEKLVSHIGILNQGEMLFQGSVKQLQEFSHRQSVLEIDTNQNGNALQILLNNNQAVRQGRDFLEVTYQGKHQVSAIVDLLAKEGFSIYRLQVIESSLEQTFLSFINK